MLYFAKTTSVRLLPLAGAEQDVPVASLRKIVFTADSIVFVPVTTAPTEGELLRVVYKYDYRTMLFVATEPIIDNGNGNYTVPANAEVTILATPNEGYEFTGWRAGNLDEMVGCYYCGTALSTNDNPMTFTMTADTAFLAEFEAAAPQMDPTVMYIAFPVENRPENIQIAGVNREFNWGMREFNDTWHVSNEDLYTTVTDTIKFRDADNNAMILCEFIPANGGQEGRWQQLYLVMGDYPIESFKLVMTRLIEDLDLSNASNYAWMENAPEPQPEGIENIVLTEKAQKVVVDGVIYIVRGGKLFNLPGAQVK